jgi:hypothetical protein
MFSSIIGLCAILACETIKFVISLATFLSLTLFQVPRAQKAGWKTAGLLTYRVGLLIVWTILALPGTVLNSPMFILASVMSRRKAKGTHVVV